MDFSPRLLAANHFRLKVFGRDSGSGSQGILLDWFGIRKLGVFCFPMSPNNELFLCNSIMGQMLCFLCVRPVLILCNAVMGKWPDSQEHLRVRCCSAAHHIPCK
jgi:hypothetical protein